MSAAFFSARVPLAVTLKALSIASIISEVAMEMTALRKASLFSVSFLNFGALFFEGADFEDVFAAVLLVLPVTVPAARTVMEDRTVTTRERHVQHAVLNLMSAISDIL